MHLPVLAGTAAPWHELPLVARILLPTTIVAIAAIVAWPLYRQIRRQRRIRKLPPPVIQVKIEPDLRLPRRNAGEPPAG